MPTNAYLTTAAIGNREDLIDVIYNTTPTDYAPVKKLEIQTFDGAGWTTIKAVSVN